MRQQRRSGRQGLRYLVLEPQCHEKHQRIGADQPTLLNGRDQGPVLMSMVGRHIG
jgi:hypothetical protein